MRTNVLYSMPYNGLVSYQKQLPLVDLSATFWAKQIKPNALIFRACNWENLRIYMVLQPTTPFRTYINSSLTTLFRIRNLCTCILLCLGKYRGRLTSFFGIWITRINRFFISFFFCLFVSECSEFQSLSPEHDAGIKWVTDRI